MEKDHSHQNRNSVLRRNFPIGEGGWAGVISSMGKFRLIFSPGRGWGEFATRASFSGGGLCRGKSKYAKFAKRDKFSKLKASW